MSVQLACASIVGINAYHQPGVEVEKAASSILCCKGVINHLQKKEEGHYTVFQIADNRPLRQIQLGFQNSENLCANQPESFERNPKVTHSTTFLLPASPKHLRVS